jgi:hypothetical protein
MSLLAFVLLAATPIAPLSFDDARWKITAEETRRESYLGRDALFLRNGEAWLDDVAFQDGIVEFDVAASEEAGFHGLSFRAQDHENNEHIYIRPHLSDKPDATQYQPIYNGNSAWQIYAGLRYAQPVTIAPNRWVHIKAAFHGRRLEFSVDGKTLVFPDLVRPLAAGSIAISSSAAGARFANVIVRPDAVEAPAGGEGAAAPEVPERSVARWRISNAFDEKNLDTAKPDQWDTIATATRGIANIATVRKRDKEHNTVFAAVTLRASAATTARLRFGFSDRVVVYFNGKAVYRGNDRFQTRDYRYLGTVGFFDEVDLPLKRGDNEVRFAVSEDFGGWAIGAQLVDSPGVEVVEP